MMRGTIALFAGIAIGCINTPLRSDEISYASKMVTKQQVQHLLAGIHRGASVSITPELQDALRPAMQPFETETGESPHNDAMIAGIRILMIR